MNLASTVTSVKVNGPALREFRQLKGRSIGSLARAAGVSTSFLARVELGKKPGVRTEVFNVLMRELGITDPRVLRAHPYELPTVNPTSEAA